VGEDSAGFPAVRLSLGALRVLVDVTLRCVDAFTLRAGEGPMPVAEVIARLVAARAGLRLLGPSPRPLVIHSPSTGAARRAVDLGRFRAWMTSWIARSA